MERTEATKAANKRWQQRNVASVACRIYRADADAFKAYAAEHGTTPNALLRGFIASCLGRPLERRSAEPAESGDS